MPPFSLVLVAAALLLLGASAETELDKGMRQVTEGDFESALITLDSLARDLAARPGPSRDRVTTYVWLGAAYSGLDQESLAIAKLEQALRLEAVLTLSAETFPPKLLRLFESAKQRIAEEKTLKKEAGAKPRKKGDLHVRTRRFGLSVPRLLGSAAIPRVEALTHQAREEPFAPDAWPRLRPTSSSLVLQESLTSAPNGV
jgi:hypothetical protein